MQGARKTYAHQRVLPLFVSRDRCGNKVSSFSGDVNTTNAADDFLTGVRVREICGEKKIASISRSFFVVPDDECQISAEVISSASSLKKAL